MASHADLISVMGGAHVLLAVMGYNFGRFFMTPAPRLDRVSRIMTSTARIAVPAVVWLGLVVALDPGVTWHNVLLLNGVIGSEEWSDPWQYWFVETAVYTFLWAAVLFALPWFDRAERRWPFWLPIGMSVAALLTRYDVVGLRDGPEEYRAHVIVWIFLLGWATAKAGHTRHRFVVSALVLSTVPGFFDELDRTLVVIAGVLLLIWLPAIRVPAILAGPITTLAGASLVIYHTLAGVPVDRRCGLPPPRHHRISRCRYRSLACRHPGFGSSGPPPPGAPRPRPRGPPTGRGPGPATGDNEVTRHVVLRPHGQVAERLYDGEEAKAERKFGR